MSEHPRPGPAADRSLEGPPFAPHARPPLCFPLTRRALVWQQLLCMALYSLCMALNIAGCLLLIDWTTQHPTLSWTDVLTIGVYLWLLLFILPTSTALCGVVFGSWRGALVAAVSTGGGLLLAQFLTSIISDFQVFSSYYALDRQPPSSLSLLCGPLAALVVGLLYECGHDEDQGKSLAILALGVAIELFGMGFATQSPKVGGVLVLVFPLCLLVLAYLEGLLRKFLAPRKHRPSEGAARR
jgi:hypothetical protein